MLDCSVTKRVHFTARTRPYLPTRAWILFAAVFTCFFVVPSFAQQDNPKTLPVVVQPGAPGQPTRILPSTTRAMLPPRSAKDVEFMQGMIMHHAQAVEMVALMQERTENKELRLLGARISQSQSAEINFMRRWLESRGESTSMKIAGMGDMDGMNTAGMDHSSHHQIQMPGMLSATQMDALAKAKGSEFDRLFLTGMIQHHGGALVMVKDLYDTAGGGQDAELFTFATDVDSGQRAEIRIMQTMLGKSQ